MLLCVFIFSSLYICISNIITIILFKTLSFPAITRHSVVLAQYRYSRRSFLILPFCFAMSTRRSNKKRSAAQALAQEVPVRSRAAADNEEEEEDEEPQEESSSFVLPTLLEEPPLAETRQQSSSSSSPPTLAATTPRGSSSGTGRLTRRNQVSGRANQPASGRQVQARSNTTAAESSTDTNLGLGSRRNSRSPANTAGTAAQTTAPPAV